MAVNKSSPLFSSCVGEVNLSSSPRASREPKASLSRVPPVSIYSCIIVIRDTSSFVHPMSINLFLALRASTP